MGELPVLEGRLGKIWGERKRDLRCVSFLYGVRGKGKDKEYFWSWQGGKLSDQ